MKKVYITVSLALICAMICICVYFQRKSIDTAYNEAISMIQNGSYEEALDGLEKVNQNVIDRDDFYWDVKLGSLEECYKNTVYLYAYAKAQLEYNSETKYMAIVNDCLELIPESYDGELSEEINTFKGNFKPQYDEYLAQKEREAEAAKAEQQKYEKEYVAGLKNKIPYKGMREKYINLTAAGNANKHTGDKYYWYSDNGKDMVLCVVCEDGVVTDVTKYYEKVYWTSNGMPKFWAVRQTPSKKSSSTKKKDDPYNVGDYSDAEDFYEDNYDDFDDYDEAEEYYDSHH